MGCVCVKDPHYGRLTELWEFCTCIYKRFFHMHILCCAHFHIPPPLLTPSKVFLPNNLSIFFGLLCFHDPLSCTKAAGISMVRGCLLEHQQLNSGYAPCPSTFNCQQLPGRDGALGGPPHTGVLSSSCYKSI